MPKPVAKQANLCGGLLNKVYQSSARQGFPKVDAGCRGPNIQLPPPTARQQSSQEQHLGCLIEMASYLSYFTSNSSSSIPQYTGQGSALSTLSSTVTSRIANLRKALTKDAEEDDPDNEDCSHVSNVLRAYYTEKGRTFPEWLPPDPKKPAPTPVAVNQYGQYGNTYGNQYGAQPSHGRGGSGGRGGLSDLWDSSPAPAQPQVQSLRTARPTPQSLKSNDPGMSQPNAGVMTSNFGQPSAGARPLPSQRAGSYQNSPGAAPGTMGSRDRLRARLQGGNNSGRNSPSALGQSSYTASSDGGGSPYMAASEPWNNANPYDQNSGYNASSNPYGRQRPGGPR